MYADRPAETFFLFHRARRILFLMSQKENGGRIPRGNGPRREPDPPARWGGHQAAFPRRNRRAVIIAESPGRRTAAQ